MTEPEIRYGYEQEPEPEVPTEPSSRLASIVRRVILAFLALTVILSMLSNLAALPETVDSASRSDLGLSEMQIVERYGPPDGRSEIQVVGADEPVGLAPRRLEQGERYFSLRYDEGPLVLVFHLVPPETYRKYNAYRVEADEWVVLERFIGTSNVIY